MQYLPKSVQNNSSYYIFGLKFRYVCKKTLFTQKSGCHNHIHLYCTTPINTKWRSTDIAASKKQ